MEENNKQAEIQAFTKKLLEAVENNEHRKFEYVHSLDEYFTARMIRSALGKLVDSFAKQKKQLFREYIAKLKTGRSDLTYLVKRRELTKLYNFYVQDYNTVFDMIEEYWAYVKCGHIFDQIVMGSYRPEEDCKDYRIYRKIF